MANGTPSFEELLVIGNRADLRAALAGFRKPLSLIETQKLVSRLRTLEPPVTNLRLGIVHTYTSELLDPWLSLAAGVQGLDLQTYHAPYGMLIQETQANSGLVVHAPDLTLLLLQREDLHPDLARPLVGLAADQQEEIGTEVL